MEKFRILINCGNKKKYIFNVHIFFSDQSEIICSLKNLQSYMLLRLHLLKKIQKNQTI